MASSLNNNVTANAGSDKVATIAQPKTAQPKTASTGRLLLALLAGQQWRLIVAVLLAVCAALLDLLVCYWLYLAAKWVLLQPQGFYWRLWNQQNKYV